MKYFSQKWIFLAQAPPFLPNTLRGDMAGPGSLAAHQKRKGNEMKTVRVGCRSGCLAAIALIISAGIVFADEEAALSPESVRALQRQEKKECILRDRQQFNRLKRGTRNIYKVTMRSTVAFRIQTALGYVSTIDLPEPALKVFVGDQELFKVEVYERQVLVKPITDEPDARTNLVIITRSGRLAFDVSTGPAETADFVLDFRLPREDEALVKNAFDEKILERTKELEGEYRKKEEELDQAVEQKSQETIKEKVASGMRTISLKRSESEGELQVNLLSLSQVADKSYLRFSILNYSKNPYRVLTASVWFETYEKRFLGRKPDGLIEIPSELKISAVVGPDKYEYGVLAFDYRVLGKNEKPVFRILEDTAGSAEPARNIEIKGFEWFKS